MLPYIFKTEWGSMTSYSFCVLLGFAALYAVLAAELKRRARLSEMPYAVLTTAGVLPAALGGAVLLQFFFNGFFKGMTFYGGLISGGLLALMKKRTSISVKDWLEIFVIPSIVFHAFGRFVCFFTGCCYGKVTEGSLGVVFPDNPAFELPHYGEKRLPTQLFESAALFILASALSLIKKNRVTVYLIGYPVRRFFIEFYRGDDRGAMIGGLSPAQWISIVLVCGVVIGWTVYLFTHRGGAEARLVAAVFSYLSEILLYIVLAPFAIAAVIRFVLWGACRSAAVRLFGGKNKATRERNAPETEKRT